MKWFGWVGKLQNFSVKSPITIPVEQIPREKYREKIPEESSLENFENRCAFILCAILGLLCARLKPGLLCARLKLGLLCARLKPEVPGVRRITEALTHLQKRREEKQADSSQSPKRVVTGTASAVGRYVLVQAVSLARDP